MKITLAKIKEHNPCADGWKKILAAQGPDMNREWPLVEALESNDLEGVLWALRCLPEHSNLWRKYAVWCAKQVDHLLTDQRSKDAIEIAWMHSNGQATEAELAAAGNAASDVPSDAAWAAALAATSDAAVAAGAAARNAAWASANDAALAATSDAEIDSSYAAWVSAKAAANAAQKEKLIQILTAGEWVEDNGK